MSTSRDRAARDLGLLTPEQAAQQLGSPVAVLRHWIRSGRLPVFLLGDQPYLCPDLVTLIRTGHAHGRMEENND